MKSTVRLTRAFVDAVEDTTARLLIDERAVDVPTSLLPEGVGEGAWIEISIAAIPEPEQGAETEALRRKLGEGDDGGDLKL